MDEGDGYTRGWDVRLTDLPSVVIQCKLSRDISALTRGLHEAQKHNPNADWHVCITKYRPSSWSTAEIMTIRQQNGKKLSYRGSLASLIKFLKELKEESK
jgi:hypothetical protein